MMKWQADSLKTTAILPSRMIFPLGVVGLCALVAGCKRSAEESVAPASQDRPVVVSAVSTEKATTETPPQVDLASNPHGLWPEKGGQFRNSHAAGRGQKIPGERIAPKVIWSQPLGAGRSEPVVGLQECYLFHRMGQEELIECRDLKTGQLQWQFGSPTAGNPLHEVTDNPAATPVLDAGFIYALGTDARLYCLSRESGDLVWLRELQLEYAPDLQQFPLSASPVLVEETLYLNLGGTVNESTILAIETQTGQTRWTALAQGRSSCPPRFVEVAGTKHLIVATPEGLASLDPETGQVQWKASGEGQSEAKQTHPATPLIVGDLIVQCVGEETICLQIQTDGSVQERWRIPARLASESDGPVSMGHHLFGLVNTSENQTCLHCYDLRSGQLQWNLPACRGPGQLLVSNDLLCFCSAQGELTVMRPERMQGTILFQSQRFLSEGLNLSAALADDILLLRNSDQVIAVELGKP